MDLVIKLVDVVRLAPRSAKQVYRLRCAGQEFREDRLAQPSGHHKDAFDQKPRATVFQ